MKRKHPKDSEVLEALRALVSDIEGMYEGEEYSAESMELEEFFGPFSVAKLGDAEPTAGVRVSWPNLAISMRNAKNALRAAHADDDPVRTP